MVCVVVQSVVSAMHLFVYLSVRNSSSQQPRGPFVPPVTEGSSEAQVPMHPYVTRLPNGQFVMMVPFQPPFSPALPPQTSKGFDQVCVCVCVCHCVCSVLVVRVCDSGCCVCV